MTGIVTRAEFAKIDKANSYHYSLGPSHLPFIRMKNPPWCAAGLDYFCHVRFLWRLAFKRLRRLCLFIFNRRFFLRFPIECGWRRLRRALEPVE